MCVKFGKHTIQCFFIIGSMQRLDLRLLCQLT